MRELPVPIAAVTTVLARLILTGENHPGSDIYLGNPKDTTQGRVRAQGLCDAILFPHTFITICALQALVTALSYSFGISSVTSWHNFDIMASCHEEDTEEPNPRWSASTESRAIDILESTTVDIVHNARETEAQTAEVKLVSAEAYRNMSRRFQWMDSLSFCLGFWLEYWGHKLLVDAEDSQDLERLVMGFATSLSDHMRTQNSIPVSTQVNLYVKVLGIGSYYSCTKKSPANEFDFLCESRMRTDRLRFVHQPLPRTETGDSSRPDFFRIYDGNQELKADQWRAAFQQGLRNTLESRYPECAIECNGPAQSFIVKSVGSNKRLKSPIKVDMTFGIPLEAEALDHIWPLQSSQVELDANSDTEATIKPLTPRLGRIAQCHFVPFGDLWRVSFAKYEGELIRQFSKEKRACFVGLKVTLTMEAVRKDTSI